MTPPPIKLYHGSPLFMGCIHTETFDSTMANLIVDVCFPVEIERLHAYMLYFCYWTVFDLCSLSDTKALKMLDIVLSVPVD